MRKIRKKGMYFTLMTIAFLLVFIFVFMMPQYSRLGEKMNVVEMRVGSMNDFIEDLKRDTERGLYISSYRAFMAIEQYVLVNGSFLDDIELRFQEALLNGTVYGANSSLMLGSRFPDWMDNIESEALELNIAVNISLHSISLHQKNPWRVHVDANLSFFINDTTGIAYWQRDEYIQTSFSILEFEDPLYIIMSFGRTSNIINITPFEGNYTYNEGGWHVENLLSHINNSYYAENDGAPSFLMRFENNLSASACCGIESLVNLKKLEEAGFPAHDLNTQSSLVDYYYWADVRNGDYRINFTPSWVKMDAGHLVKYEVDGALSYEE
jgi:hypothetical protein